MFPCFCSYNMTKYSSFLVSPRPWSEGHRGLGLEDELSAARICRCSWLASDLTGHSSHPGYSGLRELHPPLQAGEASGDPGRRRKGSAFIGQWEGCGLTGVLSMVFPVFMSQLP